MIHLKGNKMRQRLEKVLEASGNGKMGFSFKKGNLKINGSRAHSST